MTEAIVDLAGDAVALPRRRQLLALGGIVAQLAIRLGRSRTFRSAPPIALAAVAA